MASMQIRLDKKRDDVITTRVHVNRLSKSGPQSKAELVEQIVNEWCDANEYETFAVAEGIGGK